MTPRQPSAVHDIGPAPRAQSCIHIFGREGEYGVRIASDALTRHAAYRLVYGQYAAEGYVEESKAGLWLTIYDAMPDTVTVVVERDVEVIGALTIVPDSPIGLPADSLYRNDLDVLRESGRRLSEIISLAVNPDAAGGSQVFVTLCMFAYLTSWRLHGSTDMVITINPRHCRYYERRMHFMREGAERSYDKVGGAPAVLLRCALDTHRRLEGKELRHTIYRDWPSEVELEWMAGRIDATHRPMTEFEADFFLREETDIWENADESQREFVEDTIVLHNLHAVPLTAPCSRPVLPGVS
jgi:hypothetical protein